MDSEKMCDKNIWLNAAGLETYINRQCFRTVFVQNQKKNKLTECA